VLALPLHLALILDGRFPFGPVGLVHTSNSITQHRALAREEPLELEVAATSPRGHPRGRTFSLLTRALAGGEPVWEARSTMLHHERRTGGAAAHDEPPQAPSAHLSAEWRLPRDLGRRYAAVSGNRNPIHTHALAARAFGFRRAIAHGMWMKARCLAALDHRLPDAFSIDVRFRAPILLPSTVAFSKALRDDGISFWVHDPVRGELFLDGWVQPAPVTLERETDR
jgi:acyl dehydratase